MKTRFYCESCGQEVEPTARRCPSCGKSFTSVKCPQCGFEGRAPDFANGCPACGYLQGPTASITPARRARQRRAAPQPPRRPALVLPRAFYRVAFIVLGCMLAGTIILLVVM